ncbi:signal peptidase I . Serine peptidase. MEROPS family S26A [Hathewaya proteolytica DSM 3090]|uniref:Signal peptidase I n=1 Tax=Hathewaya proteolytica DSM 3090 TaxID=1121331 RepID=A0A1M6QCY0_9CLOT|nr:signal peptidase I [Hathewaya proteolytica]SHK18025.1 signal peptidase I . Serine peptidase. MEROPS family S26A [Hathewaya proteolytica DSM 3090]
MEENINSGLNGDKGNDECNNRNKLKGFFFDWILPVVVAVGVALLIINFWFFFIEVPTGSMEPTIMPNDRILVTCVYNKSKLKTGDIVVFYSKELSKENNKETNLVKRLIGKPGDHVIIEENGSVYVNNKLLDEKYVKYQLGIEKEFTVPEGKYLFLGDNRASSRDSRMWANPYIDEEDIMGKAQFVVLPFKRIGKLK